MKICQATAWSIKHPAHAYLDGETCNRGTMFLEMCKTGLDSCSDQLTRKETPGLTSQTSYAAMLLGLVAGRRY